MNIHVSFQVSRAARNTIFAFFILIANLNASVWPTAIWEKEKPESKGMDIDSLKSYSNILKSGKLGYIDGMLITRGGKIIFEEEYTHNYDSLYLQTKTAPGKYNYYDTDWHPFYRDSKLHTMQSVSKSLTSAAIAIANKNGDIPDLNANIMNYFDDYKSSKPDPRREKITILDVLNMSSGIKWDESSMAYTDPSSDCVQMELSNDWIQYVIDREMAESPGTKFNYNSGETMLLSYLINKTTGTDLAKYLEKNLFSIIGIKDYYWKHTPKGLTDAEGGLYLTPRDLARFGYLILKNGVWDGKQVLPKSWVSQIHETDINTGTDWLRYGLQFWVMPYGDNQTAILASGLGGQRMIVIPEYDIVAVFTGWNIYDVPALHSYKAMNKVINSVIPEKTFNTKILIFLCHKFL